MNTLITTYRVFLKPTLGYSCRHTPSCSEYSRQAVDKLNPLHALFLIVWRVLRCNPFSKGGLDPLPCKGRPHGK